MKQAILEKKSVILDYGIKGVFESDFEVDPFNLVFRGKKWYLVGNYRNYNRFFPFGLAYVKKVTLTDHNFSLPKDFFLDDFFQYSWGVCQAEIKKVELRVFKDNKYFMENMSPFAENISKLKDGSTLCRLKVRGVNELARWLLGFTGVVEARGLEGLKKRMNRLLEIQQKINNGKNCKVRKWVSACPLFEKYKILCNETCLDPVI